MYEIIDESLKLASCGINDLKLEQASSFLSEWEDGLTLGNLTLFIDSEKGYLVLNRDHDRYELNLKLAKAYLPASGREREEYRERFGEKFKTNLRIMDAFKIQMRVQEDMFKIEHQSLDSAMPDDSFAKWVLIALEKKHLPTCIAISQAYFYGVMDGKRMDRARRKAGAMA